MQPTDQLESLGSHLAASSAQAFGIDWLSFVIVLATAIGIATSVTALYALGLRFWAWGTPHQGNALARAASVICFGLCVAIILFALWLIVPQFH